MNLFVQGGWILNGIRDMAKWEFGRKMFGYAIPDAYNKESAKCLLMFRILMAMTLSNCAASTISYFLSPACKPIAVIVFGCTVVQIALLIHISKSRKILSASFTVATIQWLIIGVETVFLGGLTGMAPIAFSFVIIMLFVYHDAVSGFISLLLTVAFLGVVGFFEASDALPHLLKMKYVTLSSYFVACQSIAMILLLLLPSAISAFRLQQWYNSAMQVSSVGAWEWNMFSDDFQIGCVFLKQLGYSAREFPTTMSAVINYIHTEDLLKVRRALMTYAEGRSSKFDMNFRFRAKDESYHWYRCFSDVKWTGSQRNTIMIGSIIDITKQKQDEEALARCSGDLAKANLELDEFVYKASHDLRAPISSTLGLINLMRIEGKDSLEELCTLQERCMMRMDRFISDIVHYSMNNRTGLEIKRLDFVPIVHQICEYIQYIDYYDQVRFITEIHPGLEYYGDHHRVKTILKNLISNAVKFADLKKPDPYVQLRIYPSQSKTGIGIEVADNGKGIASHHLDKIFKMFYRGSESSDGSGIGLYIAKEAVTRLSGTIEVASKLNVGTKFMITLPDLRNILVSGNYTRTQNQDGRVVTSFFRDTE